MGKIEVMDETGHSKHTWDPNNEIEVEAAKRQFDFLTGEKKYAAFSVNDDGSEGKQIREFDSKAGRIIMRPALTGG